MTEQSTDWKTAKVIPLKGQKCPMCGKLTDQKFRPFCSRRCSNLDLGNWLGETYRMPTDEVPDMDEFFPDEE